MNETCGSRLTANQKSGDRSTPAVKQHNVSVAMRAATLKMYNFRTRKGAPPGKSAQPPSFYY